MFEPFGKIPRLNRDITITEKINGTNAQVLIVNYYDQDCVDLAEFEANFGVPLLYVNDLAIYAGSRKRLITPESDNFGFARWVKDNAFELAALGPGRHFGEWWGWGIQKNPLSAAKDRRYFSLFNTGRWHDPMNPWDPLPGQEFAPDCCSTVPVLYQGLYSQIAIDRALDVLRKYGSQVSAGAGPVTAPEGIIIYHHAARQYFKVTLENDAKPKGSNEEG